MKTPHIHAELIKAWADGAEIEYYRYCTQVWTLMEAPAWGIDTAQRIKPETDLDIVVGLLINKDGSIDLYPNTINLVLKVDRETGALKSAQVLT